MLGDKVLTSKDYAWGGKTLWLNANIDGLKQLRLEFAKETQPALKEPVS